MALTLRIAEVFSDTPGPRSIDEGEFSGEDFLERFLEPQFLKARESHERLIVDLDGAVGYATSFLEAAFGGLARMYDSKTVLDTVEIVCTDEPSLVEEIKHYIEDARTEGPSQNGI